MPGESLGMPGSARPTRSGRSESSRTSASTGTCPSTLYPSIRAVWHDAAASGMPCARRNDRRSASSVTLTDAPFDRRYTTHEVQQPQPGSRCTSMFTPASASVPLGASASDEGCSSPAAQPANPASTPAIATAPATQNARRLVTIPELMTTTVGRLHVQGHGHEGKHQTLITTSPHHLHIGSAASTPNGRDDAPGGQAGECTCDPCPDASY